MPYYVHRFDPSLNMGADIIVDLEKVGTKFEEFLADDIAYAELVAYDPSDPNAVGDAPAKITVNVDNIASPKVWFIHWHMLAPGVPDQTDMVILAD